MHHFAGMNPVIAKERMMMTQVPFPESVQTRFLFARWVFIDEVFMSSSQFFAEFECVLWNAVSVTFYFRKNQCCIDHSVV